MQFSQRVNRIEPKLPPSMRLTYTIAAPLPTHWRPATCAEVGCDRYARGWVTVVDETTELGQKQAHYIRHDRERRHYESRTPAGWTQFDFPPGQRCFASANSEHRVPLEREPIFVARRGDVRQYAPRHTWRTFRRAADWVDSFAEHQDTIATAFNRG